MADEVRRPPEVFGHALDSRLLDDPTVRLQLAEDMAVRKALAVFSFRGVYGIAGDGADDEAVERIWSLKGINGRSTLSGLLVAEDLLPLVDVNRIDLRLQWAFANPESYRYAFGGLCHMRLPLRGDMIDQVPPHMRSETSGGFHIQNLEPGSHGPINDLVWELRNLGVNRVAISSWNGEKNGRRMPEIIQEEEAVAFRDKAVGNGSRPPVLRVARKVRPELVGSFSILDLERLVAIREGDVPIDILERVLGVPLSREGMKVAKAEFVRPDWGSIPGWLRGATLLGWIEHHFIFEGN